MVERWPSWFNLNGDIRPTLMPFGFQCGDGWSDILWRLWVDMEPLVTELEKEINRRFEVTQVSQKFGRLGFSINHRTNDIDQRIGEAQKESSRTCEICGRPGKRREMDGWIRATCEKHAKRQQEA